MSTKPAREEGPQLDDVEVRDAIERVLASRYFANAYKKKAFVRLVCDHYLDGRAQELNEYKLGFEVFGRDSSYNPSSDPIVRVVAHEIRKKLDLYYRAEGAGDPLRLELPPGSYHPLFTRQESAPAIEPPPLAAETVPDPPVEVGAVDLHSEPEVLPLPSPASPAALEATPRRAAITTPLLSAAVTILAVSVVVLLVAYRDLEKKAAAEPAASVALRGPLWAPFFKDGSVPLVILSNPPVLRLANPSDPEAAGSNSIPLGPETVEAMKDKFVMNPEVIVRDGGAGPGAGAVKQGATPRLVYSTNVYTGMGEAIGLGRLTDFFRSADRGLLLKQSRTLSVEDVKSHNLILLGGAWVNEWSGKASGEEAFVFTSRGTVELRNPGEGEQAEYIPQFDGKTGDLAVDYALITVKPNFSETSAKMILAGVYSQGTEAAAEYVTDERHVEQLNQRLEQLAGGDRSPLYYQALLKVNVESGSPTTAAVVALRRLRPTDL